jgi:hypothetical protein
MSCLRFCQLQVVVFFGGGAFYYKKYSHTPALADLFDVFQLAQGARDTLHATSKHLKMYFFFKFTKRPEPCDSQKSGTFYSYFQNSTSKCSEEAYKVSPSF